MEYCTIAPAEGLYLKGYSPAYCNIGVETLKSRYGGSVREALRASRTAATPYRAWVPVMTLDKTEAKQFKGFPQTLNAHILDDVKDGFYVLAD
jgi:hypothetical protein